MRPRGLHLRLGGLIRGLEGLIRGLDGHGGGQKDGRTDGWKDGWKDRRIGGRLEIPPCVLQDIGPLGPLPKKYDSKRHQLDYTNFKKVSPSLSK